jgi:acetyl esterase/lipase
MNYGKISLFYFALMSISACLRAQDVIPLWQGAEMPFHKENDLVEYESEAFGTKVVYEVTNPILTIFKPQRTNTGTAILILPGGGYTLEAIYHEGYDVAKKLAENGITGAVLKYRLPNPESSDQPEKVPLADSRRALKVLRQKAVELGIDPSKTGIMGFSAGSHLATMTSLWKSEDPDENPDFSVLVYGVTDDKPDNIRWLEESLYHRPMTEKELKMNKFLGLVDAQTPPAFLVHAYDDDVCHVSESTLYAQELFEHSIPVEMHLFTRGGHGFGLGRQVDGTDQWLPLLVSWLKSDPF